MLNRTNGWTTPFSDDLPAPAIELGRDFTPSQAKTTSTPTGEELYRAFVELARTDPVYLTRLAAAFDHKAPFRKAAPVLPLSMKAIRTVEVSIDDSGPAKKTVRDRPGREALRFGCMVQVTMGKSTQVSAPDWSARAQFRTPARMLKDAAQLHRKKSITAAHRDWIVNTIVPMAQAQGWLVGCLRITTDGQGTPYSDRQVIVVDQAGIEAGELARGFIVSAAGGIDAMVELPPFVTTTSKGNQLGGGFVMQSRGSRLGTKLDWQTGELKIAAT